MTTSQQPPFSYDALRTVKVFISYSHDSPEHARQVLDLSDRLCREGVDCVIDQYVQAPEQGWARGMVQQTATSDFILVVCTEGYDKRASGAVQGKGVRFETLLTYQHLLDAGAVSRKLVPVVFTSSDVDFIPLPLRLFQHYVLDSKEGYEALYRRLTDQPKILKPLRGSVRRLPVGENRRSLVGTSAPGPPDASRETAADAYHRNPPPVNQVKETRVEAIELHIARPFSDYSLAEQEALLRAIRELLRIEGDLRITDVREGSVVISIELPAEKAQDLIGAFSQGKLKDHHVVRVHPVGAREASQQQPASAESQGRRTKGTVKWFSENAGYGFIERDDGEDLFVHYTAIKGEGFRTLKEGETVEFDVVESEYKASSKRAQAVNVDKKQ